MPDDRHGNGGASYSLSLDGELLWSRELPYAFRRCVVRDDGVAAGFAYLLPDPEGRKELCVAALSSEGEVLWVYPSDDAQTLDEERAREPTFGGVHLHGDGATLMLRSTLRDGALEEWWAFDLMNGAVDRSVMQRLPSPIAGSEMSSAAGRGVPGTPLALVYWVEFRYGRGANGVRYVLHAADGRLVWELNLHDDLGSDGTSDTQAEAALLAVGQRSFELALLKEDLRVAFEVEEGGESGWTVRETGRRRLGGLSLPKPTVETTPWRTVELEFLGEVVFEADVELPAQDELPGPLLAFDVDDAGRIGGVYGLPGRKGLAFALLDEDGRVSRSFELDLVEDVEHVRWVRGSTWFLYVDAEWPAGQGFWLEVANEELSAIESWNGLMIWDAEMHPEGDLIALGLESIRRFSPPVATSNRAERPWREPTVEPAAHLAILHDGTIAVAINGFPPRLEFFRSDGVRKQIVDLEQQLGEYGDVDELLAPDDGTLWFRNPVHERKDGLPVWHRLDAELQPLEPVVLRLENGTDVGVMLERLGPDGSGWGRDAWGPIRFDLASGRAEPIGPLRIRPLDGYAQEVMVDTQGRIYILGDGDAIFVFDPGGVLQRVCRPERGDSRGGLDLEWISVRGDGHVFGGDEWGDQRLEFDEHGRRVGVHFVGVSEEHWAFWPGGMKRWVFELPGTIELRGPEGELEARVDRLHDGRWFSGARLLTVARDGSFAFSCLNALHVFDASGAPRGSRSLAYDAEEPAYWNPWGILHEGERTILSSSGRFIAIHWDDPVAEVFELPQSKEGKLFRSPDGAELWLFPHPEPRMLRFTSPANWR